MKENTTKPLSLRFSPAVRKTIKKLSDDSGITQSQLFEMVLNAACVAIEKRDYSFRFPPVFEIAD